MGSRVLAAILSLVGPGAGHFLLGERLRASIFAGLAALVLLAVPFAPIPLLWASLGVRVLAVADVLVGVRQIRPAVVVGSAVAGPAPLVVLVVWWAAMIEIYKVPSSSMAPTANIHQHLLINKLAYVAVDPARGDLITFRNPCTPNVSFFKRVIALGGDTVEVRCNIVYVNDVAVPSEVVAEACTYDDYDDTSDRWSRPECSRYREHLGGETYEVLHSIERPDRDRDRAAGGGTYFDAGDRLGSRDWHDFPELPDPNDRLGRLQLRGTPAGPTMPSCPSREPVGEIELLPEPADPCGPRAHYRVPKGMVFTMGDNRQNSSDSRVWGPVREDMITGKAVLIWGSGGP